MKPLEPFILDGRRYYHVAAAAKIINVSSATMWRWAADGVTSFGFELDVSRYVAPDWNNGHRPRKRRDFRLLIPEEKVIVLKRLLDDFPLNPHGTVSEFERDTLQRASKLYSRREGGPAPRL